MGHGRVVFNWVTKKEGNKDAVLKEHTEAKGAEGLAALRGGEFLSLQARTACPSRYSHQVQPQVCHEDLLVPTKDRSWSICACTITQQVCTASYSLDLSFLH